MEKSSPWLLISSTPPRQKPKHQQRKCLPVSTSPQQRHAEFLLVAHGVEYGVGDLLREEALHHQVFAMVAHLGRHRFVAFNAVGDAVGEEQLVVVAGLDAVDIVESADDFGQTLLLWAVGLAGPSSLPPCVSAQLHVS